CVADYRKERYISDEEANILRSAGLMLVNAINNHQQSFLIRRAEDQNNLMLNANPLCCQLWDSNLNIIDCNDATLKFFGLKDKQTFIDFFPELSPKFQPDGTPSEKKISESIKIAFEQGRYVYEYMHQFLDSSYVPVEVTIVPVEHKSEIVVAVYLRDLREHKKMMANISYRDVLLNAVNRSAVMLLNSDVKSFKDSASLGMKAIAEALKVDCVYLWKNHMVDGKLFCSQLFEWSPKKTIFTDGTFYSYDEVVPGWEKILSKGEIINSLVRKMSQKEQAHLAGILSILVVPVFYEEMFWGFVGYDDCKKERIFTKEEEYILHSGSLLVANAFIRNEQIQFMLEGIKRERDLEIEKQAAQAANEAKTQFLARMSHEIRTPMNAIIGMSDLLLSEQLNIRQHRYAEDIKLSSNALLNIINDILDFSKIAAAKFSLVPVHYDFKACIENICAMTKSLIQDKAFANKSNAIKFIAEFSKIPNCLYGDDVRFRQILLNLLSNAVKYTNVGSITLSINVVDSNMYINLADTGEGIPADALPTLFEAFEQADTMRNRSLQGTGLGLSITRSLVELMGGNISVESVYGSGTTFHILMPFVVGNFNLVERDNDSAVIYAPHADVLVVDDRESNLSVICGLLNQCQIEAEKALSGAKAIELATRKHYDLIFMDHMMPEMDGVETTKLLREKGVNTPIIALTANAVSGAKEFLLASGMQDFLSKPIDKSMLYHILKLWLPPGKITAEHSEVSVAVKTRLPDTQDPNEKIFWENIYKIKALSPDIGLNIFSGQHNLYKNTLEIAMREMFKSIEKLYEFIARDEMNSFRIEIHGQKGSLSNIGASELASKAADIEDAAIDGEIDFCIANLPPFVDELTSLAKKLKNAFDTLRENQASLELPPDLSPILTALTDAMAIPDYAVLFEEIAKLETLEIPPELSDDIENLKEAVMIMNYDFAKSIIHRLV
ncbi:MAG: response regulator, partial [Clostridiales bacterium]|nr:response regulator [Clostridiales bacterium]